MTTADRQQFFSALVGQMPEPANTAHVDQVAAGAVEAHAAVLQAAAGEAEPAAHVPGLEDVLLGRIFGAGTPTQCSHLGDLRRSTAPRYAVTWRPGLVVCGACRPLVGERTGMRLCDSCGSAANVERTAVVDGLLTIIADLCDQCAPSFDEAD